MTWQDIYGIRMAALLEDCHAEYPGHDGMSEDVGGGNLFRLALPPDEVSVKAEL